MFQSTPNPKAGGTREHVQGSFFGSLVSIHPQPEGWGNPPIAQGWDLAKYSFNPPPTRRLGEHAARPHQLRTGVRVSIHPQPEGWGNVMFSFALS